MKLIIKINNCFYKELKMKNNKKEDIRGRSLVLLFNSFIHKKEAHNESKQVEEGSNQIRQ